MSKITSINAREVLSSKCIPSIEIEVCNEKGFRGTYIVDAKRDNDERYFGKGVLKEIDNINEISSSIIGMESSKQKELDEKLITLCDKKTILGISIASLIASHKESGKDLYEYISPLHNKIPKSMFNMINKSDGLDFYNYMIVPKMESFKESVRCASEVYYSLNDLIDNNELKDNKSALNNLVKAISSAGYTPGKDVFLAINVNADKIYDEKRNTYKIEGKTLSKEELLDYYLDLLKSYPIISLEDAYSSKDEDGFKLISEKLNKGINLVGNNIFVSNKEKLKNGIDSNICNSIMISKNNIRTFYEMLELIVYSKKNNYTVIISGDDEFFIELAVSLGLPFIKYNSVVGLESTSLFNRLLKIEEKLDKKEEI